MPKSRIFGIADCGLWVSDWGDAALHSFASFFRVFAFLRFLNHQHIAGLQIAVDDPAIVGVLHRVADPDHHLQALDDRATLRPGPFIERSAVDVFHGEERTQSPVGLRHARLVHVSDGWMLQPGEQIRLALKPLGGLRYAQPAVQHLYRYAATRAVLFGLVHRTHPADADQPFNAILPEGLADQAAAVRRNGANGIWALGISKELRNRLPFEEPVGRLSVVVQQRLDLGPQCFIVAALAAQEFRPRLLGQFDYL
jgi:hypothetical protein